MGKIDLCEIFSSCWSKRSYVRTTDYYIVQPRTLGYRDFSVSYFFFFFAVKGPGFLLSFSFLPAFRHRYPLLPYLRKCPKATPSCSISCLAVILVWRALRSYAKCMINSLISAYKCIVTGCQVLTVMQSHQWDSEVYCPDWIPQQLHSEFPYNFFPPIMDTSVMLTEAL